MNRYIDFADEVREALEKHKPIVAIETGGTFEGIPYPENAATALHVMDEVRKTGAVPAYISIMDGRVKVGMTEEEIHAYAKLRGTMQKASRREIPQLIAQGRSGVMTIAATMVIADYVGIPVVSGGGIGGVHRGAEKTMDISSDLEEIAERNVIVVCSGAKSILDLNLTMEYLETKAVSVIGYQTDELPAYMARTSGIRLTCRMDDACEVAKAYKVKNEFGIKTGMLLANPIDEAFAVDADCMNRVIDEAVKKSKEEQISGKAITGYLMKYVKEKMGSDSMEAQKHMILQNARLASEVAGLLEKEDAVRPQAVREGRLYRLETNIDDCTGEQLGYVLEKLYEAGARDVHYIPVFMKKGRPAYELVVVCAKEDVYKLENIIFLHTTTLGIRRGEIVTNYLERSLETLHTSFGDVTVKKCLLPNQEMRYYPEYEMVKALADRANIPYGDVICEIQRALHEKRETARGDV